MMIKLMKGERAVGRVSKQKAVESKERVDQEVLG